MKPRILFILHFPPPLHGSAVVGQYIKDSRQISEAFECDFVNLSTSRSMGEIGRKSIKKVFIYLSIVSAVTKKLLTNHYDLCYITITAKGGAFYKDSLIACLAKWFGIKVVYHLHNKGVSNRQDKWLDHLLYKLVFINSSVILLSRYLYPDVQKYVTPDRVHYCPNGIPPVDNEGPVSRPESGPVEILFISNMIESKGVFVLLDACRILKDKGYSFVCRFVGALSDVTQERLYARVSQNGLAKHVFYEGKKYGRDKEYCLRRADIFAFPTYYECFPLVVLEAMQFSLPVVSTHEGGIPEIVEEGRTGFLCPQKDVTALAEKLELLIKDQTLREQMGAAGYRKYKQEYTLEKFENRLKDILLSITTATAVDTGSEICPK
jgi:glycosyltransferase involved in cell wall biosynthesis